MKYLTPIPLVVLALVSTLHPAHAQSTAWNYQGYLTDGGTGANGLFEMTFGLFTDDIGGISVVTVTNTSVEVVEGLFTTTLDFGAAVFDGTDYWLEIGVREEGGGEFTALSPRQPLNTVPYAMHAKTAKDVVNPSFLGTTTSLPLDLRANDTRVMSFEAGTDALGQQGVNVIGGYSSNTVSNSVIGATVSGGGGKVDFGYGNFVDSPNKVGSSFATIGGGYGNINNSFGATIGGGGYNSINGLGLQTIGGGSFNVISNSGLATISGGGGDGWDTGGNMIFDSAYSVVAGGADNIISNRFSGVANTISGGAGNVIESAYGSVIGGGGYVADGELLRSLGNKIRRGKHCLIAGGDRNCIGSDRDALTIEGDSWRVIGASVSGGERNRIKDGAYYSTISGGINNSIETTAHNGTITGGIMNTIRSNAFYAVVAGGAANSAGGACAFAAGCYAQADHLGSFVWADASDLESDTTSFPPSGIPFSSATPNEFAVRATGGIRFVTGIDAAGTPTAGISVPAGGTGWDVISDRNMKENFEPVDGKELLDRVVSMPISRWNMKSQSDHIRHIGPMAQDFHAAFGLGESDRRINTVDADGVALAAIQGLNQKLEEQLQVKDREIQELKVTVAELKELISQLAKP